MSDRDYTCPKCGGWLEMINEDRYDCDTCEYSTGREDEDYCNDVIAMMGDDKNDD